MVLVLIECIDAARQNKLNNIHAVYEANQQVLNGQLYKTNLNWYYISLMLSAECILLMKDKSYTKCNKLLNQAIRVREDVQQLTIFKPILCSKKLSQSYVFLTFYLYIIHAQTYSVTGQSFECLNYCYTVLKKIKSYFKETGSKGYSKYTYSYFEGKINSIYFVTQQEYQN